MFLSQFHKKIHAIFSQSPIPNHFKIAIAIHSILLLSFIGSSVSLAISSASARSTIEIVKPVVFVTATPTPFPTIQVTPTPTKVVQITPSAPSYATPATKSQQTLLLESLNAYRSQHGKPELSWNQALGNFAQSRASLFAERGDTDSHAGFKSLINSSDGFQSMGFFALGENSSYGHNVDAKVLIESVYGGHGSHSDNQLNSEWTHVGIGVSGVATDFVFGGRKI